MPTTPTPTPTEVEIPTVNLVVLRGVASGPPEVRTLDSGTRLATLSVRVHSLGPSSTSVPVAVWDPPAWVETVDLVVVVSSVVVSARRRRHAAAALLPAGRGRCRCPGRGGRAARGAWDRPTSSQGRAPARRRSARGSRVSTDFSRPRVQVRNAATL